MRFLYSLALYLSTPLILFHLLWRGFGNRAYWRRWGERFGYLPAALEDPFDLWVHAVSVGEAQTAVPLIKRLREHRPGMRILVTTTTPTGSERVRSTLGDTVGHAYVPYDLPGSVHRFLQKVEPGLAVFMETELWPNAFHQCARRSIPVVVVNARLSARSAQGYLRFPVLAKQMMADISAIAAQSKDDSRRFIQMGAPEGRAHVTGSIKFDIRLPASLLERAQVLRRKWGGQRKVWIAASTHEGEDEQVLRAFTLILKEIPDCLLLLVPRHPERFTKVKDLAGRRGFVTALRTGASEHWPGAQLLVVDTMGELPLFYAASDAAFVGGSLIPHGGHNMLEAAALGKPVIVGPHLFNFSEISQLLLNRQAMRTVENPQELADTVLELLKDANLRHNMGENGRLVVGENRGALEKVTTLIETYLKR